MTTILDPIPLEVTTDQTVQPLTPEPAAAVAPPGFDEDLIKKYPRSNRKIQVGLAPYGLSNDNDLKGQTLHISPYGMEIQSTKDYAEGTLLKIHVSLPDYWQRKQQFVEYRRIDTPGTFKVLAKVVRTEEVGKRGKKKLVVVQTVNMDEIDEQVLKSFLQDG
jgi:hypothetical protein